MAWHRLSMVIVASLFTLGCTNHHINFDTFPNGAAVPSWDGTPLTSASPSVVTTQYAPSGIASFSSAGGGVFMLADTTVETQPNTACPIGVPFGYRDGFGPITITLAQSTTNFWVTIPAHYSPVTVVGRDGNGTALDTEQSDGPNAEQSTLGRRVRLNASGITSVYLDTRPPGGNYCIDDVTWQEPW